MSQSKGTTASLTGSLILLHQIELMIPHPHPKLAPPQFFPTLAHGNTKKLRAKFDSSLSLSPPIQSSASPF